MEDSPFSGPYGEGWRLVCPPDRSVVLYIRLVMVPPLVLGGIMVYTMLNWERFPEDRLDLFVIIPAFLLSLLGAYTYIVHVRHPARVLELTPDSVMLFEKGRGEKPVVDIPFTRHVEVDALVKEDPGWEGNLMLVGWTFRKGREHLRLDPDDHWDLWQLQDLERPVLWLVERYGMVKAEGLEAYLHQLESPTEGG